MEGAGEMQLRGRVFFWFATRLATPLVLTVFALALLSETRYLQALPSPQITVATPGAALAGVATPEPDQRHADGVIRRGETLSETFTGLGLSSAEAHGASTELARFVDPRRVRVGDRYRALLDREGQLREFFYAVSGKGDALLTRAQGAWQASFRPYERSVRPRAINGVLRGSLESSLREAGADPTVGYRMADVLQWDLDFNRDLQPGDGFSALYEEVYLDGQLQGLGEVIALRYRNGGKTLEAYRYGDGGYYDQDGRPLRKMFLKSPLPYSRVTSGFSQRRFHPVLRTYRPHWGVDLGAPVGTPVRVTGNGVVLSAGWDGGGGKVVKVRHPGGYVTQYLHLSRFASGIGSGARVSQGDVIAYVGQSGLATGPHLDYRVQKNGSWINPTSLGGVQAEPIPVAGLSTFMKWRDALRASLDGRGPVPASPGRDVVAAATRSSTPVAARSRRLGR
jgi:murein DD-endopeptidase MepM/ murein hydrolase activator NlpD